MNDKLARPAFTLGKLQHNLFRLGGAGGAGCDLQNVTAIGFVGAPPIERLGIAVPMGDLPLQIGGNHRLPDRIQQASLEINLIFGLFARDSFGDHVSQGL